MTRQILAAPLAATRTRRTEWLYADRIPLRTGTIIAGQGGIAKSTIISSIIAQATNGTLPGTFYGTPVKVAMISPEDDIESVLVPRLMAAGANLENIVYMSVSVTDGDKSWTTLPNIADDLPAIGDKIDQHKIRLLVVDPLVSIMSGNSISQSDVRRNFDPLSALAKSHDFAVLAVAHFGKSGERAGDRLSGSHAFRDIARVLIVAAVDDETGLRVLTVEKSNYSPTLPSDAYQIDSRDVVLDDGYTQSIGHAVLVGASAVTVQEIMDRDRDDTSKLSGTSQKIIECVERHPDGVKAETVVNETGLDDSTVRKYLGRAATRGDIVRLERGIFAPVSRGVSVQSGSNSTHLTHIGHFSSRDTCPICGEGLHAGLIAAGIHAHPNCQEASVLGVTA